MNIQIANRNVKVTTIIASALCAIAALLLTLTWFMPATKIYGESMSAKDMVDTMTFLFGSDADEVAEMFWALIFVDAFAIIWACIPTIWASVTGTLYSILPAVLSVAWVHDMIANEFEMAIGTALMIPLAVLAFLLSVVKLVFLIKGRKQSPVNNGANVMTPEG